MGHNPYAPPSTSVADVDTVALPRPTVVTVGIWIFWVLMIVGAVSSIYEFAKTDFPETVLSRGALLGILLTAMALVYALAYAVIRGAGVGRNWARITLAVLVGITVAITVLFGPKQLQPDPTSRIVFLVQTALQSIAVILLFLPASNAWYASKRKA